MPTYNYPRSLPELLQLRKTFTGNIAEEQQEWIESNGITAEELGMLSNHTKSHRHETGQEVPLFPLELFAMPTELARTSLFCIRGRSRREIYVWERISSRADIQIDYFGVELDNQLDLELWLLAISIARGQIAGSRIPVTLRALIKGLGRTVSGQARRNVKRALDRLASATLRILLQRNNREYHLTTSLLNWGINEKTDRMFLRVDPDGYLLFENLSYLDFDVHLQLEGGVAKSLHTYAISHKQGNKHSQALKNLKAWFGYEGRMNDFLAALKEGLRQLEEQGVIRESKIFNSTDGASASWILNSRKK